jgi:siderophore synthetase component
VERYDRAVPGARAAVLSRLLGALDREPLPGLDAGRVITFPAEAARPFATASAGLTVIVDGTALDDPGSLARALWPGSNLATEIDNSVANLALARAAAPPVDATALRDATGDPDGLGRLEQLVVDGHPLHPCCRTRAGMTVADVLAYAPEHHPVIHLRRLRVPADRWHGTTKPILYAHPWQAERLRDAYPWLTDDGPTGPVRPLMSLRTLAPLDGGDHLKTAVDVQMTSAVRTVSPAAVHNGPRLSALLRELTADLPLTCLAETGAGAVIVDGEPSRHLAYLRREAPRVGPNEVVLPLGATALISAAARTDPYGWFAGLAAILWGPLVTVLDRGVALEAHGQNTLVVLRDGRPARILYRDLGGVRVSARRLRAAGVEPPDLLGDLPSDDPAVLRTKLAASALATVATELITVLTRDHGTNPARLWQDVAASMRGAGALLRDPLPIKATTAMRLAADPLTDIWATIDNPLAAYA